MGIYLPGSTRVRARQRGAVQLTTSEPFQLSPADFGASEATCLTLHAGCLQTVRSVRRQSGARTVARRDSPTSLIAGGQRQRGPLAEHTYRRDDRCARPPPQRVPECRPGSADLFGITSWTLRRRLADESTSYSTIRKRVQLSIATEFLRRSDLTINEVADMANFGDVGAFRRAFQQWTGRSPSASREDVLHA